MSSIKPPDGRLPAAPLGPTGNRELGGPEGAEKAGGPAFRELLEGARPVDAGQAAAAQAGAAGSVGTDPIHALAQAVRAGAISPQQALDQLVERAASGVASGLSQAQRAELVVVLRTALESDPALRELRDAIG
jgi:hypothetical protein